MRDASGARRSGAEDGGAFHRQMRAEMSMFCTVNSTLILFYGFRYRFA